MTVLPAQGMLKFNLCKGTSAASALGLGGWARMVSQPLAAWPNFPLDLPLDLAYNKIPNSWKRQLATQRWLSQQAGSAHGQNRVPLQFGVAHK